MKKNFSTVFMIIEGRLCYSIGFILSITTLCLSHSRDSTHSELCLSARLCFNERVAVYAASKEIQLGSKRQPLLLTRGFCGGTRAYIAPWLRLQSYLSFDWGRTVQDTLHYPGASDIFYDVFDFSTISVSSEIHMLRTVSFFKPQVFLGLGGGFRYLSLKELLVLARDQNKVVLDPSFNSLAGETFSGHLSVSAGIDIPVTFVGIVSIEYMYTLGKPVSLQDARDLPLKSILYEEFFFSHMLMVSIVYSV